MYHLRCLRLFFWFCSLVRRKFHINTSWAYKICWKRSKVLQSVWACVKTINVTYTVSGIWEAWWNVLVLLLQCGEGKLQRSRGVATSSMLHRNGRDEGVEGKSDAARGRVRELWNKRKKKKKETLLMRAQHRRRLNVTNGSAKREGEWQGDTGFMRQVLRCGGSIQYFPSDSAPTANQTQMRNTNTCTVAQKLQCNPGIFPSHVFFSLQHCLLQLLL